ncbi:MAG: hypothetical protein ACO331_11375 [Prochlorothrix sp.]
MPSDTSRYNGVQKKKQALTPIAIIQQPYSYIARSPYSPIDILPDRHIYRSPYLSSHPQHPSPTNLNQPDPEPASP